MLLRNLIRIAQRMKRRQHAFYTVSYMTNVNFDKSARDPILRLELYPDPYPDFHTQQHPSNDNDTKAKCLY